MFQSYRQIISARKSPPFRGSAVTPNLWGCGAARVGPGCDPVWSICSTSFNGHIELSRGMPLIPHKHRQAFLYLSLVIMGMILLGVSLPSLRFQAGLPFPGADKTSIYAPVGKPGFSNSASPLLLPYGLALGIILLFISLIIALLKKVNTKRICLLAAVLVVLFVFFSVLPDLAPSQADSNPDNISTLPTWSLLLVLSAG